MLSALTTTVKASFFNDLLNLIRGIKPYDSSSDINQTITQDTNENLVINDVCFNQELEIGNENEDVTKLQQVLCDKNFYEECLVTGYFGSLTKKAVIKFQSYYFDEILKPLGLLKATGYVGSATLKKLNSLTQCVIKTNNTSNFSALEFESTTTTTLLIPTFDSSTTSTTKANISNTEPYVVNSKCMAFPSEAFVNEPVFITGNYNTKNKYLPSSPNWKPLKQDTLSSKTEQWVFLDNQSENDVKILYDCGNFIWSATPYPYKAGDGSTNFEDVQSRCFVFSKPGRYQLKITNNSKNNIVTNYVCDFKVSEKPKYKIFFGTNELYDGDFNYDPYTKSYKGADTICNKHAKQLGYKTEFEALLDLKKISGIYRLPTEYFENQAPDTKAKQLNVNYKGFVCDSTWSKYIVNNGVCTIVSGVPRSSSFCILPSWYPTSIGLSFKGKTNWMFSSEAWILSFLSDCNGSTAKSSCKYNSQFYATNSWNVTGQSNFRPFPGVNAEGVIDPLKKGMVPCNTKLSLICAEIEVHTDEERK